MDLSVVVPAYNMEGCIERCLRALRDQAMGPEDYEIIVIDDGSTDDTPGIARQHALEDPRIVVQSQSNQGLSAARNAGLDRASGQYVYFVDADDRVVRGSLRAVISAAREHDLEVACVGWQRVGSDQAANDGANRSPDANAVEVVSGLDYLTEQLEYPTSVWASLFERALLDRVGLRFEVGRFYEDQLFMAEALAAADRVARVPVDVYRYTVRPGSITRSADPEHTLRLCADLEHVVSGLENLADRAIASGAATPELLDRLRVMQEGYVFLLIVRLVRSRVPLWPALPETVARLEAAGHYAKKRFPTADRDHQGRRYRVVTTVLFRQWLLYPSAVAYRAAVAVWRHLPGQGG